MGILEGEGILQLRWHFQVVSGTLGRAAESVASRQGRFPSPLLCPGETPTWSTGPSAGLSSSRQTVNCWESAMEGAELSERWKSPLQTSKPTWTLSCATCCGESAVGGRLGPAGGWLWAGICSLLHEAVAGWEEQHYHARLHFLNSVEILFLWLYLHDCDFSSLLTLISACLHAPRNVCVFFLFCSLVTCTLGWVPCTACSPALLFIFFPFLTSVHICIFPVEEAYSLEQLCANLHCVCFVISESWSELFLLISLSFFFWGDAVSSSLDASGFEFPNNATFMDHWCFLIFLSSLPALKQKQLFVEL